MTSIVNYRVVRQRWINPSLSGDASGDFTYTYDRNGNVLTRDYGATGTNGDFDEQYTYDGLDRLASFKRGTLSAGTISGGNNKFSQDWTALDTQGNWQTFGEDVDGNGGTSATSQARASNAANETGASQIKGDRDRFLGSKLRDASRNCDRRRGPAWSRIMR